MLTAIFDFIKISVLILWVFVMTYIYFYQFDTTFNLTVKMGHSGNGWYSSWNLQSFNGETDLIQSINLFNKLFFSQQNDILFKSKV